MTATKSALADVQRAVYARLTSDPDLMGMITGVYDHVPEGTAYPYVTVGESIETPDNRHGGYGRSTVCTIHVWSRYRGYADALRISGRIIDLLDLEPLEVPGREHISTRCEYAQTIPDPDPMVHHIPMRFRITTGQ